MRMVILLQCHKHVTAVSTVSSSCVSYAESDVHSMMLVHAFATSCIDYCNGLLAGAPKVVMDKLQ